MAQWNKAIAGPARPATRSRSSARSAAVAERCAAGHRPDRPHICGGDRRHRDKAVVRPPGCGWRPGASRGHPSARSASGQSRQRRCNCQQPTRRPCRAPRSRSGYRSCRDGLGAMPAPERAGAAARAASAGTGQDGHTALSITTEQHTDPAPRRPRTRHGPDSTLATQPTARPGNGARDPFRSAV